MHYDIEARVISEAKYVLGSGATVRATAEKFGVSKSTVHSDLTVRLRKLDVGLYDGVKNVLYVNLAERHIRGGIATREKFRKSGGEKR